MQQDQSFRMDQVQVGKMLHHTLKAMLRSLNCQFAENAIPLTADRFIVMKIIAMNDGLIQQELAEFMGRDKSSMFRLINALQEDMLIARISDPKDKRRNHIVLTKKGSDLFDQAKIIQNKVINILLKDVEPEDFKVFMKVQNCIQNNAKDCFN